MDERLEKEKYIKVANAHVNWLNKRAHLAAKLEIRVEELERVSVNKFLDRLRTLSGTGNGTAEECAEELGVSTDYIRWMITPYGRKLTNSRKYPNKSTTAVKLD